MVYKLYKVAVPVYFVADNNVEIEAIKALKEQFEMVDIDDLVYFNSDVKQVSYTDEIDDTWLDAIPFGTVDDDTCKEIIENHKVLMRLNYKKYLEKK